MRLLQVRSIVAVGVLLTLIAMAYGWNCQYESEDYDMQPSLPSTDEEFGKAVDILGSYCLIGAPAYNGDVGRAFLFSPTGSQTALVGTGSTADDKYGMSVAVGQTTSSYWLVVGAPGEDNGDGGIHIYDDSDSWDIHSAIDGPTGAEAFGAAVALSGDYLVVGAPETDYTYQSTTYTDCGVAYVYKWNGSSWPLQGALPPPPAYLANNLDFGRSVAVYEDGNETLIIVGGPGGGMWQPYVGEDDDWDEEDAWDYTDLDGIDAGDKLGRSVAVHKGLAIVGAPLADVDSTTCGSAQTFKRIGGSWHQSDELLPCEMDDGQRFGWSVDIYDGSTDWAVVGAPCHIGTGSGIAHIFKRFSEGWSETTAQRISGAANGDEIGRSVAICPTLSYILFGAPGDASDNGKAFTVSSWNSTSGDCPCDINGDGLVDVLDLLAVHAAWGTCSNCPEDLNNDGNVNVSDMLMIFAAWGPCSAQGRSDPPASVQDCIKLYGDDPDALEACLIAVLG